MANDLLHFNASRHRSNYKEASFQRGDYEQVCREYSGFFREIRLVEDRNTEGHNGVENINHKGKQSRESKDARKAFLVVESLEGRKYKVHLTNEGWIVHYDSPSHCTNLNADDIIRDQSTKSPANNGNKNYESESKEASEQKGEDINGRCFETFESLAMTVSPQFQKRWHSTLFDKLASLEESQ